MVQERERRRFTAEYEAEAVRLADLVGFGRRGRARGHAARAAPLPVPAQLLIVDEIGHLPVVPGGALSNCARLAIMPNTSSPCGSFAAECIEVR
jgi:hypothetical protein